MKYKIHFITRYKLYNHKIYNKYKYTKYIQLIKYTNKLNKAKYKINPKAE